MKYVAGLMLAMAAACGGSGRAAPDAGDGEVSAIALGSGETAFEAIVDEQHLKLYAGTQGGYHVWLSYRVEGLTPENVRMELDVVPMPPARPAHSNVLIDLTPAAGGGPGHEFVGWPAQVLDPECAVGRAVSIALTLTDARGRRASGAIDVIPEPPDLGFSRACAL